jgi:hypothetical protein
MLKTLALLGGAVAVSADGSFSLTQANWKAEVQESGKAAFVKFQAPW